MEHDESQPLKNDEPKDIFVGQIVKNIDQAYNLYQTHAFKMDFSVRKGFKNNELQGEVAYERADSRTGCEAMRYGKSKLDYDCFGDVMVFDTTCRTNRFNLICAPVVGVNHQWKNVMFGCALLADETAVSFTWLFKAFLESMGNQQPKTIFTDQDASMAKAIRECMSGCDLEEEFESTWKEMMSKHNDHKWLEDMYEICHKWSTAYSKEVFAAGIKSSQQSGSTNSVLSEIAEHKET
ncbi:hypothetical protein Lal_00032301 [Lupinus albus]|nr:hypothetical protein Lal_00032301 [Lupinus albus]